MNCTEILQESINFLLCMESVINNNKKKILILLWTLAHFGLVMYLQFSQSLVKLRRPSNASYLSIQLLILRLSFAECDAIQRLFSKMACHKGSSLAIFLMVDISGLLDEHVAILILSVGKNNLKGGLNMACGLDLACGSWTNPIYCMYLWSQSSMWAGSSAVGAPCSIRGQSGVSTACLLAWPYALVWPDLSHRPA